RRGLSPALGLKLGKQGEVLVAAAEMRDVALAQRRAELLLERSGETVEVGAFHLQDVPAEPRHQLARRTRFHQPALADEYDAVAAVGFLQVVGREQHGHPGARAQALDEAPDAPPVG